MAYFRRRHASAAKLRFFSLDELEAATSNFSPSSLLGRGSHGSVFLANLDNEHLVAVKLPVSNNELSILSSLPRRRRRSPFLVNLIGHTLNEPIIGVFDHMPGGSLETLLHIHQNPPPPHHRLRLALDIAESLAFLHSMSIVHRDIKPSNILIDSVGRARISDFSLAARLSDNVMPVPAGTMGYIDPGYIISSDISSSCDVYSFGVVLLEMMSGRRAIDFENSPAEVVEWAAKMEERFEEMTEEVMVMAGRCVAADVEARPCMAEVAEVLRRVVRTRLPRMVTWRWIVGTFSGGIRTRDRKVSDVAV